MRYVRAIISSDARGTLYKRDFEVEKVFRLFVRTFVTTLIDTGTIVEGEFYNALIIPRYGKFIVASPSTPGDALAGRSRVISLGFEEPVQPEHAMDYFTIDIHVAGRAANTKTFRIRANFQMAQLDYFWINIEQALYQMKILQSGEHYHRRLYARDDEQANFEQDEIGAALENIEGLIEIMPTGPVNPSMPLKSFADFQITATKKLVRGKLIDDINGSPVLHPDEVSQEPEMHIFITGTILESIQDMARSGSRVEQGGVLVGLVSQDKDTHDYLVEISGHIPAEGAVANEVELRYTFESWQHQTALLRERFPSKRIVGWYHTHLDLVKKTYTTGQGSYSTPLFFSQDDLFTHRQFFREKWYVAMVLDPEGNLTFFQWYGDVIGECRHFYVVGEGKNEGAIHAPGNDTETE